MNLSKQALPLPERTYLSAQAAAAVRQAIREGRWREYLPSERRLCEMLHVSRPTVRAALHALAKEGWLRIRQGRRSELLSEPKRRIAPERRLVALIVNVPASHLPQFLYRSFSEMRAHLAEHGFTTEIVVCQARGAAAQRVKVEAFLRQNPVFCCVLVSVGRELQQWFAAQSFPALVLGSRHPGVSLPSLEVDYRLVCRHAAGVFLGRGHRRLALVVPDLGVAGDLASEQGFREGIDRRNPGGEAHGIVVRHRGTMAHLYARLDELFRGPQPPTALLVARPRHTLWVLLYLSKHGLAVPDTVSLIARDYENLFDHAVSHYTFESDTFARRLSHLMLQMVAQGSLPPEPNLIFPKYQPGVTVRHLGSTRAGAAPRRLGGAAGLPAADRSIRK